MPNGHGGARPGAGRKPKATKYASEIADAERKIADRLPELVDNLFALAAGVKVEEAARDGTVDVFTRPPDRQANEYLLNRILGRPTERHQHEFSGLSDEEIIRMATEAFGGAGGPGAEPPTDGDGECC